MRSEGKRRATKVNGDKTMRTEAQREASRINGSKSKGPTTPEGKDAIVGFLGEKAVQKPVQLGIAEGDLVEVEGDDVSEDDAIVTKGAYGLPGEAKVRVESGEPKTPAEPPRK